MKYFFPDPRKGYTYLQTNRSDDLGSLWSTHNLDFQTNLGTMRLAQKLVINTSSADDADLGVPCAFTYFADRWWAICGTRVFKNSSEAMAGSFSEDTSTGFQTDYDFEESDLALFDDRLWSTTGDSLYSKPSNTGDWTSRDSLGSGVNKLAYFKKFDRLYYTDTTTNISSIDAANVVSNSAGDYFLDIGDTAGILTTIVSNSQFIWIGTMIQSNSTSGFGEVGAVLQWDGISAQVTNAFPINAAAVLAMTVLNDIPYCIDSEGRILKYTGYSFEEIARLPVNRTLLVGATVSGTSNGRFVHFNGLQSTKNNTLLVLVNNLNEDDGGTINENLPSGIWELDLATGNFTHRYSPTLKARSSSTVTDFGQNRIVSAGALKLGYLEEDSSVGRSTMLAGFAYFTDATTEASAIFIDSPAKPSTDTEGQKRGYFVTTWFNSEEIQDKFLRLWATFRTFLNSTDKAIFKYRITEEEPIEATITWTSTTTFTTTTDVSAYGPTATGFNGTTGGEVEVLQGTGSGSCTHITNISEAGGTYTVTLDNAVTGVTGTAKARFQKWIKIFPEVTGQVLSYGQMAIGASNTRIQIKGVLEFTGDDEFHKFAIFSNPDITITA